MFDKAKIAKALRICAGIDCRNCPYAGVGSRPGIGDCSAKLLRDAADALDGGEKNDKG